MNRRMHGKCKTKLYNAYHNMIRRCEDPKTDSYKYYGERGISVCPEWRSNVESFMSWAESNGYEEGLSIDRINSDRDYEPSNCRWTDWTTQTTNQRMKSSNTSGFPGVNKRPSGRWTVQINAFKDRKILGTFDYPWTAAMVRDSYIIMNNLPNKTTLI